MVRTQTMISCALAVTVVRADVSSSWTSIAWSQAEGATFEKHQRVTSDAGRMHEEIQKWTDKGTKVVEQVDMTSDGSAMRDQVEMVSIDGGVVRAETDAVTSIVAGQVHKELDQATSSDGQLQTEHVELTQDKLGNLHGKKDTIRCVGGSCNEVLSLLVSQSGMPLRERPLVASGWRVAPEHPGLRGPVPVHRVHVPCHRAAHGAPPAAGGFQIHQAPQPAASGQQMQMKLVVADPEAFVADPRAKEAVRVAIAKQLGVDPKTVHVTLAVGHEPATTAFVPPEQSSIVAPFMASFGVGVMGAMCLAAAFFAPIMRRRRKAARWEQTLNAGSRLEAMYEGEWFSGALVKTQKTPEGYWVVHCDADSEGQYLHTLDIRPSPTAPENDLHAALLSPVSKTNPVARASAFATFACGVVDEKMASQAYVCRLYQREAASQEDRAARAYASRVVARALAM